MNKLIISLTILCCLTIGKIQAQQQTIYTQNGKIFKKNGEQIILRGVNYNFLDDGNITLTGTSTSYQHYINQVALTGANSIRIPWFTDNFNHWRKQYPSSGTPQAAIDNGKLSEILSYCHTKNLIPILELHDFTCKNDWNTFMTEAQNFWLQPNMLSIIQQHKEYLIINIANEFGSVRWTNNTASALSTFTNNYKSLVANFRNAGIDVPIMIDAPDCGQSSSELLAAAPQILTADPLQKLIFSAHSYWYGYAPNIASVNNKINEASTSTIPFVFGEVSNRQDKTGNPSDGVYNIDYVYQTILSQACSKEIGWLIWAFNHDWHPDREISPTSNVTNLTPFGQDILYNPSYGLLTSNCSSNSLQIDNDKKDSTSIVPNPAQHSISIKGVANIKKVLLYNSVGQLTKVIENNFEHISIEDIPSGSYNVIIITSSHKTSQYKIIKL